MSREREEDRVHLCPMHSDVRQAGSGKCPKCGMALLPEGTRFGILRHLAGNPWMLAVMLSLMTATMAAIMVMVHWR